MLFLLVALLFVKKGESGEGMKLTKCLDPNTGAIARPLPLPSACKDKDPVICNAIFSPRVPDIPNNAVALVTTSIISLHEFDHFNFLYFIAFPIRFIIEENLL